MSSVSRIDQCKKSFCVPYEYERQVEFFHFMRKTDKKSLEEVIKKLKNKNLSIDERKELQQKYKKLTALLKKKLKTKKNSFYMDNCMESFCNPSCLGTLLAKGKKFPILSARRRSILQANKYLIKFEKKTRKKTLYS